MRIALAALAVALAVASPLRARAADRLVTVGGEATIAVAPDTAIIRIGVTSQGKNAREASEANARHITAVLAAIKASGIDDRDIQTSRLSLQPQYDPNKSGTARLTGFQVTNQLTVRIHDIGKLPDILDRAIAAGANEMSGIEFAVSQQSRLLDQRAPRRWPTRGAKPSSTRRPPAPSSAACCRSPTRARRRRARWCRPCAPARCRWRPANRCCGWR